MTVARTDKEALSPLAQRLCSEEGTRRLLRRLILGVLIAVLGPMLIAVVGALVFLDEIKDAHQSGTEVWGLPIVATGEEPRGWVSIGPRAVGVVAIGELPIGVFAIGDVAIGVVAIGAVGIGVVSVGLVVLGLWPLGIVAMGFASVGGVAMGRLAFGGVVTGWYAYGGVSLGAYAWGLVASGFFRAESRTIPTPAPPAPPTERELLLFPNWRRPRPASG